MRVSYDVEQATEYPEVQDRYQLSEHAAVAKTVEMGYTVDEGDFDAV